MTVTFGTPLALLLLFLVPLSLRFARGKLFETSRYRQSFVAIDIRLVEHTHRVMALDESPCRYKQHRRGANDPHTRSSLAKFVLPHRSDRDNKSQHRDVVSDENLIMNWLKFAPGQNLLVKNDDHRQGQS